MVLLEILLTIAIILCSLRTIYYIVGAIKECFWSSTKRYLPYWLYNGYIFVALLNLLIGHYIIAFGWSAIAAFEYYIKADFINKVKD